MCCAGPQKRPGRRARSGVPARTAATGRGATSPGWGGQMPRPPPSLRVGPSLPAPRFRRPAAFPCCSTPPLSPARPPPLSPRPIPLAARLCPIRPPLLAPHVPPQARTPLVATPRFLCPAPLPRPSSPLTSLLRPPLRGAGRRWPPAFFGCCARQSVRSLSGIPRLGWAGGGWALSIFRVAPKAPASLARPVLVSAAHYGPPNFVLSRLGCR